jgi:hypothetical protein
LRKKQLEKVAEKLKGFELRQVAREVKRARVRQYAKEHMEMKRSFAKGK